MGSYTITIAPNDDSGTATRLVVETSGDQVRITDVHLHAPQGLSTGHIPTVDVDMLLQAVSGTVTASIGQSAAGAAVLSPPPSSAALEAAAATGLVDQAAAPVATKGRTRKAAPRTAATPAPRAARAGTAAAASADEAATPRRAARGTATSTAGTGKQPSVKTAGKAVTAKTAPAAARKRATASSAVSAKSPTSGRRTRAASAIAAPAASGRVYRRTPDDLAAVFARVNAVAGVAEHYQVPRYTAQGWVGRLRATA